MNNVADAEQGHPRKWLVLILVATGTFAGTLDISIIDIALPTLTRVFRVTITISQWFLLAYALTNTFLLPAAGKASDLFGRRRVYVWGLVIFAIGSLASGLSFSAPMLIVTRAFQGIGSAILIAGGPPLLIAAFLKAQRGRSLGFMGIGVGLGMLAGPLVGGLLVHHAGWRWIFLVNVPIAAIAAYIMWRMIEDLNEGARGNLDVAGTALLAVALTSPVLAMSYGQARGWLTAIPISLFGMGLVALVAFLLFEPRTPEPVLELSFFRKRNFLVGVFTAAANYAAMIPTAVFTPFYVQNVLGYNPDKAGVVLASGPMALIVVAPTAGIISDKIGSRALTTIGLIVTGFASLIMCTLTEHSAWPDIVWRLALVSLGSGLFVTPNARSVLSSVREEHVGTAAGILSLLRDIGIVFGAGVAAAIIMTIAPGFSLSFARSHAHHVAGSSFLDGLRGAFLAAAGIAFLGAVLSAFRRRDRS